MYIKQIIIEGFKSYGQKTVVEFHPKHNAITGENGSGKSSLFVAIQFVLSKEFITLTKDQRLDLLNKRPGLRSASVEIIFDNSDKRLPIDKETVSVKRICFLKSDQFLLNGKVISPSDISHFLEIAGFFKSSSYYIIKQGKISEFALLPETRLQLLHEIAGTKFYKDHKKDILITLHAIQKKKNYIENILKTIGENEIILKRDVEQFKEYESLRKHKTTIEFIMHERTVNDNKRYLKQLENKAEALNKDHNKLVNDLQILQEHIKISDNEIKKFKKYKERNRSEKKNLNLEQEKLLQEKNKLDINIAELIEDKRTNYHTCQKIDEQLEELNSLIKEKEKKLQKIQYLCEQKLAEEESINTKLELNERLRTELCKKRGKGSQFKNKEERDLWIKQELQQLEKQISDMNNDKLKIEQEKKNDEKEHDKIEKRIAEFEKMCIDQKRKLKDFQLELNDLKGKKDKLLALSNELCKEFKNYTDQSTSLKNKITKLERTLKSIFGVPLIDGKNSVLKVLEIFKNNENIRSRLTEYHGFIIENFKCNSEMFKAVEETAGKQLFYHIVETSEFGDEILNEMNRQHFPGEPTFLPLDSLQVPFLSYPENKESIPLISKLTYDDKHKKPLMRIFGKTLMCSDLEVATIFAKKYHFDCVTVQGDKAASNGLVKGGHFHNLHSPIKIQLEITDTSNEISLLNDKLNSIKEKMQKNDNDISACISGQQNSEVKINKTSKTISGIKSQINVMKKELDEKHKSVITKENNLKEYEKQLTAMFALQNSLNDELFQDVVENLSVHDQQQMENLNDSITQLKIELRKIYNERNKLELEKKELENELHTRLICQKNELEDAKENMSLENIQKSWNLLNDEFKRKESAILKYEEDIKKLDEKAKKLHEEQKKEVLKREKLQVEEKKLLNDVAEDAKQLEKVTSKIDEVRKIIENSSQKKSKLGIPNKNLYEKFNKMKNKELSKTFHHTTQRLTVYDKINTKALDQFTEFSNQKQLLNTRKKEIDKACINIQELLSIIEKRKCEAIEFMFEQISKYFTDIFKKLVPNGNAYLVMKTAGVNSQNDTDTISECIEEYDNLIGVDIMAKFTGSEETREMHNLSGGQKSLLSIAFIFAIQKCQSAPYYLFDEIDQDLDTNYRDAVIKMILERSRNAQFFTISFRPEFIQHANKFHCVTFQNDTSQIRTITRDEATSFLKDQQLSNISP